VIFLIKAQKRDQVLSQIDSLLVNKPENIAGFDPHIFAGNQHQAIINCRTQHPSTCTHTRTFASIAVPTGEITCNVKELISEAKTVNSEKSNFEFGRKLKRNTTSIFKRQREVMKKIKQLRKN